MPDKCLDCPAPSADMDGFIVSGPGGAPRSEGSGVSSPEGPFVREAPRTGHVVIMGTLGADGNPGSLPDAPQVGWAYVAEDAGEYGGVSATEGDMVYCMSLNPVKWGVLQADSDDSGRSLTGVSAEVSCTGWRTAEDAELLGACCLRRHDASGRCYGPDSASLEGGVLTVVWKSRQNAQWLDVNVRFASGEGHVRVDMLQIDSLVYRDEHGMDDVGPCPPGGCVWNFEDVRARAALESFSGEPDPADPQHGQIITAAFRLEERSASSLDVYARAADGTVSKTSSPLPCLDAALVSAKADASCAGRIVPAESAKFYINFRSGGVANYSEDIDARSGSFVLSGAHVDWAVRNYSSSSYVRLSFSVPGEDGDVFLSESANSFARVFNGTLQPGAVISMSGGSRPYGLVLAERTELTSEDEGGPDVLVRFQIVDAGRGPSVAVVAETLGGDVSVGTGDLSCLDDRITSVSVSLRCSSNYAITDSSSITVGTDMMYYADDAFPSDFCDPSSIVTASLAGGSFEIRGMDCERMDSACSASATFAFILDSGAFGRISASDFAKFFDGRIAQGGHLDSMNGRLRFVLNSCSELTPQDPGGPDTVVSLSVYEAYPALTLTLTSAKADGTSSAQTVGSNMSCLVPPVFNGSVDGLVPANIPATQTADLLSDDGTWMRPATDAEIDAIFAE